jgi:hypothetical protein
MQKKPANVTIIFISDTVFGIKFFVVSLATAGTVFYEIRKVKHNFTFKFLTSSQTWEKRLIDACLSVCLSVCRHESSTKFDIREFF